MNGTNGVMQTPVNSSNNVAFTTAISVGVLFGILVTFVAIVGIVILRRRRYWKHFDISLRVCFRYWLCRAGIK